MWSISILTYSLGISSDHCNSDMDHKRKRRYFEIRTKDFQRIKGNIQNYHAKYYM
jgi:hypothetical protein